MTVLEPVKLNLDPAVARQDRRQAAGAALYGIMSEMIYQHHLDRPHIAEALIEAGEEYGMKRVAVEDPVTGAFTYKRCCSAIRILGRS